MSSAMVIGDDEGVSTRTGQVVPPADLLERAAEEEGAALFSVRDSRPAIVLAPGARLSLDPVAQREVA